MGKIFDIRGVEVLGMKWNHWCLPKTGSRACGEGESSMVEG